MKKLINENLGTIIVVFSVLVSGGISLGVTINKTDFNKENTKRVEEKVDRVDDKADNNYRSQMETNTEEAIILERYKVLLEQLDKMVESNTKKIEEMRR